MVFQNNWDALNSGKYKYIINSGSSRSSKTFSILQIFWLLAWTKPRTKLAVFRYTKKDCKDTILQDMLKYYPTLDNYNLLTFNKTESIFSSLMVSKNAEPSVSIPIVKLTQSTIAISLLAGKRTGTSLMPDDVFTKCV